jgi:3-oxoadipate enol-lactonase
MNTLMHHATGNDRHFARDGVTLRYRDEGSGPAVVMIHGWLLDLSIWDREADALSATYRVIRTDRRGFGASTGRPDLRADAADLSQLLDRLAIPKAAIVAMSQGTRVALRLALTDPARVSCLVLDGTPVLDGLRGGPWQEETPLERYRDLLHANGIDAVRRELASHPLMRLVTDDPRARDSLERMLARYDGADLHRAPPASDGVCASDLAHLSMPVLVLNGEQDVPQRRRAGAELARAIPHAVRRVVPRAGHLACLDNPDAYVARLVEFLNQHCNRGA